MYGVTPPYIVCNKQESIYFFLSLKEKYAVVIASRCLRGDYDVDVVAIKGPYV